MDHLIGPLLEATFALLRAGFRRATDDPRPTAIVRRSLWHAVGLLALAGQAAVIGIAIVALGRAAISMIGDDLMMILAMIFVPAALVAIALGVCTIGFMVGTARKLTECDASARFELAVGGVVGALLAAWLAHDSGSMWAIALLVPCLLAVMVVCVRSAWIAEAEADYGL